MKKAEVGRRRAEGGEVAELAPMDRPQSPAGWLLRLGALFATLFFPAAAFAQRAKPAANVPTGPLTYDSFKLIHTRNVFDPDRRPPRAAGSTPTVPTGRADYLALTGTLLDANKSYAFFSGSRPDFNKVLTVGDKIANSTIAQITSLNIAVDRDGKRTVVVVGQTVPLDAKSVPGAVPVNAVDAVSDTGGGAPPLAPPVVAGGTAPVAAATNGNAAPTAPGGSKSPPNLEETRRKMMEKRNQELK